MIAPRGGTVLTTLRGYHLFMQRPTFLRLKDLPLPQLVAELRRPEVKAAILAESDVRDERPGSMENALPSLFRSSLALTFPLTDPLDYEPTLDQALSRPGRRPRAATTIEYLYDFLLGDGGNAVGVVFGANYVDGNLDACREMLLDPNTVLGPLRRRRPRQLHLRHVEPDVPPDPLGAGPQPGREAADRGGGGQGDQRAGRAVRLHRPRRARHPACGPT